MNPFLQGLLGGIVPAFVMVLVYFLSTERRLTRIETDLSWLKKTVPGCQPHLKDPTR